MMISATKSISPWLVAVELAVVAPSALAGEQPQPSLDPVVTVRFADLNTSTPEGSRILYGRIAKAALDVCSTGADWYPSKHGSDQECYRATLDQVIAKLNLLTLTALHVARTKHSAPTPSLQAGNR
jgi:UrcA family protein